MPSPVGHVLAGGAVSLLAHGRLGPDRELGLRAAVCLGAALAALPDADLIIQPFYPTHRTVTHSLISVPAITILATLVTGWVTGRRSLRVGLLCGLAWGSHIPLDWLGADPNPPSGIQLLWPFDGRWFISGLDLFPGTERRQLLTPDAIATNTRAVLSELALLGPVVALLEWRRRRHAARQQPSAAPSRVRRV